MAEPASMDASGPRVEFKGEVLQQIRRHARSSMRAEICGVLIGRSANGTTRVEACIAGEKAEQGGAHVTFTQETWEHIYRIKDAQFPDQAIVGWYHSHPGFGIFLSDYDLFIHENFFNAPHQLAWVYDPHSDEEGCFGWIGKKVCALPSIAVTREHREPENRDDGSGAPEKGESGKSGIPKPLREDEAADSAPEDNSSGMGSIVVRVVALVAAFAAGVYLGPEIVEFGGGSGQSARSIESAQPPLPVATPSPPAVTIDIPTEAPSAPAQAPPSTPPVANPPAATPVPQQ